MLGFKLLPYSSLQEPIHGSRLYTHPKFQVTWGRPWVSPSLRKLSRLVLALFSEGSSTTWKAAGLVRFQDYSFSIYKLVFLVTIPQVVCRNFPFIIGEPHSTRCYDQARGLFICSKPHKTLWDVWGFFGGERKCLIKSLSVEVLN